MTGRRASELIRKVVAGDLTEPELNSAWPKTTNVPLDLENCRANLVALYVARRSGDRELSQLLAEDLADAASALEAGRPLQWFEVVPKWTKPAHTVAFVVGAAGWLVSQLQDWPRWTKWAPLLAALAIVWFAEWVWSRRQDAG